MLVKMKKALKDLATANFTKNLSEKYVNSHFFSIKFVFALKHISITNQEIMEDILFDFLFW